MTSVETLVSAPTAIPAGRMVRIADIGVSVDATWAPARPHVERAFAAHERTDGPIHLEIGVEPHVPRRRRSLSDAPGFSTVYGRFLRADWEFGDSVRVTVAPNLSPLRLIRPLVDLEGHPIHLDTGRILIERVLTTYVQLCRAGSLSYLHGAAMADESGRGLVVTGHGGVGKTSLALELGLNHGWRFISDDMVPVDQTGTMFLNANHPKIYGYNVLGDPGLEARLLAGRSAADRLHWRVRRRWPSHVRRAIDPAVLYGGVVRSAPMRWVLMVERTDVARIELQPVSAVEAAGASAEVLVDELRKSTPDVETFLGTASGASVSGLSWGPEAWESTLRPSFGRADILRVLVPRSMTAVEYRSAMMAVVAEVTGGS